MKSIILRLMLALAALGSVPNAMAADSDSGNFFLDGRFGEMSNSTDWGDVGPSTQVHAGWGAGGGYRWNINDTDSLGLELGYMHFGDVSDGFDANGFTAETTSANAMTLGALFQHPFAAVQTWYFQARFGLMSAKLDATYTFDMGGPPFASSNSFRQNGAYFGLGIGHQITQGFSLTLAYTRYNTSAAADTNQIDLGVNWVGLEAEYRF